MLNTNKWGASKYWQILSYETEVKQTCYSFAVGMGTSVGGPFQVIIGHN